MTLILSGAFALVVALSGNETSATAAPDAIGVSGPSAGLAPLELDIWKDPNFRRRFQQSYLAESDVEPTITLLEREDIEKFSKLMADERADRAVELLENKRGPNASAVFDFLLANVHFQKDELDQAQALYEAAVEKCPKYLRAWKNLGVIHARKGDYRAALPALTKVLELGGNDALNYGTLGYAHYNVGNFLSAESGYRMALLLDPETEEWRVGLLRSVLEQQRYAEASALCAAMLRDQPERADLWLLQGNAFLGLGEPLRAAENFELVERLGGATPYSLNKLGDIYYNQEVFDLAAEKYRKAFALDVERGLEPLLRSTRRLIARGALDASRTTLAFVHERVPELDPEREKELLKLEARVAVAGGDSEDEGRILEEIVRLDPLDGEALILLGERSARAGDAERAAFWYERAAGIEEHEAEAKLQHGRLLVGEARYEEALPLLARSQALRPRDSLADYVKEIERLAKRR